MLKHVCASDAAHPHGSRCCINTHMQFERMLILNRSADAARPGPGGLGQIRSDPHAYDHDTVVAVAWAKHAPELRAHRGAHPDVHDWMRVQHPR